MTRSLEVLSRQMGSMESIHSVVRTMKTLSVINSAPYEQAVSAVEAFHRTVLDGLHAFLAATGPVEIGGGAVGARVVVVFGSDHGLCGSYNEGLAAHLRDRLGAAPDGAVTILCVGARMADALADRALAARRVFLPPASVEGIGRLANLLTRHLDAVRRGAVPREIAVDLVHVARGDGGAQAPVTRPLLPLAPSVLRDLQAAPWRSRSLPAFAMPAPDLFRALIRGYVYATLFRASAEAMVTENAARLAVMQQAEQSVEDRLTALAAEANALRQSGITTELLDVIVGFEALKARRRNPPPVDRRDAEASDGRCKQENKTP